MLLLIDNYDSFTFNLVQLFEKLGVSPVVLRNDDPSLPHLCKEPSLKGVVISPGPGGPMDSGLCLKVIEMLDPSVPVLGVCLGHQILGYFAGFPIVGARNIMHGKTSLIYHRAHPLFEGMDNPFSAVRYHSLVIAPSALEKGIGRLDVEVIATSDDQEIMGICYRDRPWMGVQFHPESILSPTGPRMVENFLEHFVRKINPTI